MLLVLRISILINDTDIVDGNTYHITRVTFDFLLNICVDAGLTKQLRQRIY